MPTPNEKYIKTIQHFIEYTYESEICLQMCHPDDLKNLLEKIDSVITQVREEAKRETARDILEKFVEAEPEAQNAVTLKDIVEDYE